METLNTTPADAELILWNRSKLRLQGIEDVVSFDDLIIYMITKNGNLTIEGSSLHITMLDVSNGNMMVEGNINAIIYNDKEPLTKHGFFSKLLK